MTDTYKLAVGVSCELKSVTIIMIDTQVIESCELHGCTVHQ